MKYQPIIGLEVHVELKTKSKMFCRCSADYFGKEPNTHTCPVCLGLPGALPVPNRTAIEWCMKIGAALNCELPLVSKFDRKNYFYPDLSKGYQISQYDEPFAINGRIKIKVKNEELKIEEEKIVRIRRVHMEEDTGKLTHATVNGENVSLIDFNRSGVPLVEIVTEPDFNSASEVVAYLKKLQQIVRYLDVSNADMEKGDMRLEPNISLLKITGHPDSTKAEEGSQDSSAKPQNDKVVLPNYKVEVKNINSFRFVEKSIEYEIERQAQLLDNGERPAQETRGWNEAKQKTISQRAKEEANDYRYFPEPDIPPFRWTESYIENIKQNLPELPDAKFERFQKQYEIPAYDAEILTREIETADFFEEAATVGQKHTITPKQIANKIINEKIDVEKIEPATLVENIKNLKVAVSDTITVDDESVIKHVLENNQKVVDEIKAGKENAIMFLVGQSMKALKGKVKAEKVREKIKELIASN